MSHFVFMNTQKMFGLKKSDICFEQKTGKWKVSVNKTFMHVQEQKKAMPPRHSAYIPSSVKTPIS